MAFPNTLFPCIPLKTEVTDEEYRLFHAIDIKLIKILVRRLGRDHFDAMNVVAFLLWLERSRLSVNAVYKLGNLYWPDHLLGRLADQVVALLGWLTNPTLVWEMRGDISLIEELCDREVDFVELRRRRLEILEEKRKIVDEMCRRAFVEKFSGDQLENDNGGIAAGPAYNPQELQDNNYKGIGVEVGNASGFAGGPVHDPRELIMNKNMNGVHPFSKGPVAIGPRRAEGHEIGSSGTGGNMDKNLGRRPLSEYELSKLLPGLNITEEETHIHYDDRTVFLTFSKGYPVTESELWDFFTRRFGNFIKGINFEKVPNGVQPLYARMVALNTSILPLICDVHIRTKYIINGRHVWARKYVRKN